MHKYVLTKQSLWVCLVMHCTEQNNELLIFFFTLYQIYHFLLILKLTTFTLFCTSTYQTKFMGNALYRTE